MHLCQKLCMFSQIVFFNLTLIYRNKNLFLKYGIKYFFRGNREQQKFKHELN